MIAWTHVRPTKSRRWPLAAPTTTCAPVPATARKGCGGAFRQSRPRSARNVSILVAASSLASPLSPGATSAPLTSMRTRQNWTWLTPQVARSRPWTKRASRTSVAAGTSAANSRSVARQSYIATSCAAGRSAAPSCGAPTVANKTPSPENATWSTPTRCTPRIIARTSSVVADHTKTFGRAPSSPVATHVSPSAWCTRKHSTQSAWC